MVVLYPKEGGTREQYTVPLSGGGKFFLSLLRSASLELPILESIGICIGILYIYITIALNMFDIIHYFLDITVTHNSFA